MLCLMIPLPLVVYMSSLQQNRYRKSMSCVMLLSVLNAVVWPVLHFTGILPFYRVRMVANAVLVILAVSGMAILVADAVRKRIFSYHYTFIGFMGFLLGCLMELTLILIGVAGNESVSMLFGLGFFLTFVVIQQVHDLRKINMERQRAIDISEAKTRFLASMSHEIRTPINAILGMNEMILRENKDKAVEEYSRNIKTSGKMLLMLVNDVLDFSKIEAGKLEIRESDFRMSEMLYDVLSLVRKRAEEKDLTLESKITGEVPEEMIGDEFRIRQILINLLNNAVKYTDRGTVTLLIGGSRAEDGFLLDLRVRDTGKGIRKADQEHLFEAFSRADVKSNANIEGTGLGLAIVKSIVDSMNGELGVQSEYGEGSEFWVRLSMKYKGEELLREDFAERENVQTSAKSSCSFTAPDARILAVDDNQSNLKIVRLFLKRSGIIPDLCSSGDQAAQLCREKKYDLILLDHMMPEPDGIETLHIIRSDEASLNKETKAVVLTANAVAGSRRMYLDEGFDDYLTKPLDSGVLEEAVRRLLPKDKVIEGPAAEGTEALAGSNIQDAESDLPQKGPDTQDVGSVEPVSPVEAPTMAGAGDSFRSRLSAIEGLDYETALDHCAGEEVFLQEIIAEVAKECPIRAESMRKNLAAKDIKAYIIDAHTVKNALATIGLKAFSERAKMHEYAAKENDLAFLEEDGEAFIRAYTELGRRLADL